MGQTNIVNTDVLKSYDIDDIDNYLLSHEQFKVMLKLSSKLHRIRPIISQRSCI
jgi:hypothetical protein